MNIIAMSVYVWCCVVVCSGEQRPCTRPEGCNSNEKNILMNLVNTSLKPLNMSLEKKVSSLLAGFGGGVCVLFF